MAEREKRWGKPASGRSSLLFAVVVVLLAVVFWLLSERNQRRYTLAYENGLVSVKKGILFPVGDQPFKTDDPQLAQAYAPFAPPRGAKLEEARVFDERAGLDQALFVDLARWAREDIASERPAELERGLGWLARAEKLQQISAAQRAELAELRAESGYFEARGLVERAAEALRLARERLRLSSGSASPHAGDAARALRRLEPLVEETQRAGENLAPAGSPKEPLPGEAPAEGAAPPEEVPAKGASPLDEAAGPAPGESAPAPAAPQPPASAPAAAEPPPKPPAPGAPPPDAAPAQ